jgi:hypothetical protein
MSPTAGPGLAQSNVSSQLLSATKRRVRTEAQLERKRSIDRQNKRIRRQRNKDHINKIEKTLSCIQSQFSSMSGALYEMQLRVSQSSIHSTLGSSDMTYEPRVSPAVAGGKSTVVSPATSSDSDFNTMIEEQQSCISSNASSRDPIQRISTAQDTRIFENRETSEEFTSNCALEETHSGMELPRVMPREYGLFSDMKLHEASTVASVSTSATDISILEDATTPSPHVSLSSGFRCQCDVAHTTETEGCFEYSTFSIFSKAHLALLEDFKSAQLIPRNPSLANLLLLDIHSNPVRPWFYFQATKSYHACRFYGSLFHHVSAPSGTFF